MTLSTASRRQARPVVAVLAALLMIVSCSSQDPEPDSNGATAGDAAVTLFDPAVIHDISVKYDQNAYDTMIKAYADNGDKNWIEATVTVDGVTFERAGLRLKGNSSLMGLGGNRPPGAGANGQQPPAGMGPAGTRPATQPGAGDRGGFPGMGSGAGADSPERLPWLIRLDQFVDGQHHQGYSDIVVRSSSSTTSLNEAVALDLLDTADLASQLAVSTSFSVNGGKPILRLAIEHPDDDAWQERSFSEPGALYKAESTGDWSYRGDDPDAYAEIFDQEGGKQVADLDPLIGLLKFINQADDATFAAELPKHLDVDAFATYLALMDLTDNFDDIDGPGNNAYLWWDQQSGRFTIVPWDMNLAFGAMGGMPGGMPNGASPPEGFNPGNLPEGFNPGNLPEGAVPPGGAGRAGPFGRSNILVTRFHANAGFEQLYQQKLNDLRHELFGTGTAGSSLDARVKTLQTDDTLVDAGTLEKEADALRQQLKATADGT